MDKIEQTKKNNPDEKNMKSANNPLAKKNDALKDDKSLTMDVQLNYPLLKPIAFSNPMHDDYIYGGVWHVKG